MDLDLTEAVEAAARAAFEANATADASAWAHVDPMTKYRMRQAVLPSILAAAPVIARQVGEQIAQAIDYACIDDGHTGGNGVCERCSELVRIARGGDGDV